MNPLSSPIRRWISTILPVTYLLLASTAYGQALPAFSPLIAHPTLGSTVHDIATGDLNGDSKVDVVVTRNGGGEVGVNVSLGDGTGQLAFLGVFGAGRFVNSVALADFNGDNRLDAVMANNADSTFSVLFGDGSGALGGEVTYGFPTPVKVATADFDGDGDADVAVMNGNTLIAYLNSGAGVLSAAFSRPYSTPNCCTYSGYSDITVADVNRDGKQDLAITIGTYDYGGEPQIQIMRGLGNGTFQPTLYYRYPNHPTIGRPVGYHTTSITAADVTGDSWPDLVFGAQRTWTPSGSPSAVVVMRNDQTGQFLQSGGSVHYLTHIYGAGAYVGDLNNDTYLDLVAPISDGVLHYFLNNGAGSFGPVNLVGGLGYVTTAALADLNSSGPGTLDVIMGRYYGPVISLLNGTPVVDSDGDGVNDNFDVFPNDPTESADNDGDGVGNNGDPFPNDPCNFYFFDALSGPASPCLTVPSDKYTYAAGGLLRSSSDSGTGNGIDRPAVKTASGAYLTGDFTFDVDVQIPSSSEDIAFVGFGQGNPNPNYHNEPTNAFVFRIHNLGGFQRIDATVEVSGPETFAAFHEGVGQYPAGQRATFRIKRVGDNVTMSVVGQPGSSRTLSIAASAPFLNATNAYLFVANSAEGTVFSNFSVTVPVTDTDGDGTPDDEDAFPEDPTETTDTDGDGTGDNGDAFPNDANETADSDNDGVGDNGDLYPNDPSASANIIIGTIVTSVPARNGAQLILDTGVPSCSASAKNHGQYVSCVGKILNSLKAAGLITAAEKDYLQSVVAQSAVGKK